MRDTLFLRLEGPLQSWGLRARWGERDTADAPTKSGIIGLLGCALGYLRADPRLQQHSDALQYGVRIDLTGSYLYDYHTTGGGKYGGLRHDGGSRFHTDPYVGGVLSAETDSKGRIKVKINANTKEPETDVSNRIYLMDASFLVALQGPAELIGELAQAVQNPVWPYYLGRKACIPAVPIYAGTGHFADLKQALASAVPSARVEHAWQAKKPERLRLLLETLPGNGNRQYDAIEQPATRVFRARFVREDWCLLPNAGAAAAESQVQIINTLEG
jgi:CRISPR system Cascade subunit CasD